MVYIVDINPAGFDDMHTENIFGAYEDAKNFALEHANCNGPDCEYHIYEAMNEFTAKRKLLEEF